MDPDHSPTGTRADLQRMAEYLRSCQDIARTLAEAGSIELEEINSSVIPQAYANWLMPRFYYANLNFLVRQYQSVGLGMEGQTIKSASNSFRP